MKFGFSLLLATATIGAAFAHTSAHATTLPAKPAVESAVTNTTFQVDHKKKKHASAAHKHGHPHKHAHLKKPLPKKH